MWERSHDTNREAVILKRIRMVNVNAGAREAKGRKGAAFCRVFMDGVGSDSDQNRSVVRYSKTGSCLLHGTKELVRMAIRRSRGDSISADWEIPAALQTKPMAVVRHCFVQHIQRR